MASPDDFDDEVDQAEPAGPYARAAELYYRAGWPAPIPVTGKFPPVTGFTGAEGKWPSFPDIMTWVEYDGARNIGLRLPDGLLGIDVDEYDSKHGARTLAGCVDKWGELPATFSSTSRTDGVSRIRYYRIPQGLSWPGNLPGGDVEIIVWNYRYSMCWPSVHPTTRAEYFWLDIDGQRVDAIPKISSAPMLPFRWIQGLSKGQFAEAPRADVEARSWLGKLPDATLNACDHMRTIATAVIGSLTAGSRHDTLLDGSMKLIRAAEQGHPGAAGALAALHQSFVQIVTADGSRAERAAESEWGRALDGAVSRVAATPTKRMSTGDPCRNMPAAGLSVALAEQVPANPPMDSSWLPAWLTAAPDDCEWWPTDMTAMMTGAAPDALPTELARTDGVCLWYPGKVNGLLGPSESGKTWVAFEALRRAVTAGRRVLFLDFEDSAPGMIERLRALGVPDQAILANVAYVAPTTPLSKPEEEAFARVVATFRPHLVILDGVNAAMTIMGLDLMSNTDATRFHQILLAPLAETGATVVFVDHVPKNDPEKASAGGIGAQAKRATVTGASIRVEVIKAFGRGKSGVLKLTVDKDKGGHVRANATAGAKTIGIVTVESSEDGKSVTIDIRPDEDSVDEETGEWRPTEIMRKIMDHLRMQLEPVTQRDVERGVGGRLTYVRKALKCLVDDQEIVAESGPRNATLYSVSVSASTASEFVPSESGTHRSVRPQDPKAASPPGARTRSIGEQLLIFNQNSPDAVDDGGVGE